MFHVESWSGVVLDSERRWRMWTFLCRETPMVGVDYSLLKRVFVDHLRNCDSSVRIYLWRGGLYVNTRQECHPLARV
jgi:hypothetical protein